MASNLQMFVKSIVHQPLACEVIDQTIAGEDRVPFRALSTVLPPSYCLGKRQVLAAKVSPNQDLGTFF